ncbi:hypothetical protein BFP72_08795 [Reichenbachiella sp. 5M10]|nr:hypothetical protein BFP72_08795 [Reichenbachiella sp. 5M10]
MSSCEKIFFEDIKSESEPYENFNYLWEQADLKYSYFEVKNIDWDDSYTRHEAMLYPEMSEDSLFSVLGSMISELRDDHTNLLSAVNYSYYGVRYHYADNFDFRIVEDNYLNDRWIKSGPFIHNFIADGKVGYIRFSSFTGTVDDVNLDYIINKYSVDEVEGLVFDIRENGGGAVTDVFNILARFIDDETVVYKSRIRNGKNHSDFSDLEEAIAEPADGPRYTNKPVIFLCDRGTYSAGSFTSLSTKAIPNITLMGDTTGGGLGLPNGGQLPNGWDYRFSVTQAMSVAQADSLEAGFEDIINQENFERGVPPDVVVSFDWSDLTKDEILDAAIDRILNP